MPGDFRVFNNTVAEQTCVSISGFSDEITCTFTSVSKILGNTLVVSGGFDSKAYTGGLISFNIS